MSGREPRAERMCIPEGDHVSITLGSSTPNPEAIAHSEWRPFINPASLQLQERGDRKEGG